MRHSLYTTKSRRMMYSLPSKNKMNKGRKVPSVLKHYILLLMFQSLRPLCVSVTYHLVQSKGQNTGISRYCFKQRICHGDWISIWSTPSESSSYLIVMSRVFRMANVLANMFITELLSQRRIWMSDSGMGQGKPRAGNWICVLISLSIHSGRAM